MLLYVYLACQINICKSVEPKILITRHSPIQET